MKIKKTLLIFLLGLIVGVGLSPLASSKPQEILYSPVSLTMAQTSELNLPIWEGEVLGAMVVIENEQPRELGRVKGSFGEIIREEDKLLEEDVLEEERELVLVEAEEGREEETKEQVDNDEVKVVSNKANSLTIAVLGDSMVDTMGEGLPYLDKVLRGYYPNYFFNLLNYGAGATNIEYGIQRLTSDYQYLDKKIPALIATHPDIVIVESFAYNPWGGEKGDLDRHWLAMAKIVEVLKSRTSAKILFLSTIAPNKENFGSGPAGINWNKNQGWQHAEKINKYLENTLRFAASQNIPVIDAYNPSIVNGDGNLAYINPGDHIHPSVKGCQLVADLIAKKLVNLGWIR